MPAVQPKMSDISLKQPPPRHLPRFLRHFIIPFTALLLSVALLITFLVSKTVYQITSVPQSNPLSTQVTIGIKTYACDASVIRLLSQLVISIRVSYPTVRIIIANDGPLPLHPEPFLLSDPHASEIRLPLDAGISVGRNTMVRETRTPFFMLLDDDHLLGPTNISALLRAARGWDVVGMRVLNLPGIAELEHDNIFIPRYVANISRYHNRDLTLCIWNENVGPGVYGMKTPLRVDVLHNALVARTQVLRLHGWRDELKVNEHMTFFLDARKAGLRVGYLPSVYVHHRRRERSTCYERVRDREGLFDKLLDYNNDFLWEKGCYQRFVAYARQHLERDV